MAIAHAYADFAIWYGISGCSEKRSGLAILQTFSGHLRSGLADETTAYYYQLWPLRERR